jgi:hypothetical protein
MPMLRLEPLALVLALTAAAPVAAQQPAPPADAPDGPAKRAEKLFQEGLAASERGDYVGACAKFAASLDLVARPSTYLNLGTCNSEQGKLVAAYRSYMQGLALLPANDPRLAETTKLIDALSGRVPRLAIALAPDTPAEATVRVDGEEVARKDLGSVLVDPGRHTISLRVPGRVDATVEIDAAEGDRKRVELAPGPIDAAATPTPASEPPARSPAVPDEPAAEDDTLFAAGLGVGAVGVASAIAAGVTGGLIIANDSTIKDDCPDQRCNQEGIDLVDTNNTLLVVNAVTFGVAAAGIGVGAALLIADAVMSSGGENDEAVVVPVATPGGGGFAVRF